MIIRKGNQGDLDAALINLAKLNVEKMPYDMKVALEKLKKKRTNDQNALLWKWCQDYGDETGNTKEVIYKHLEKELCPFIQHCINGEESFIQDAKNLEPDKFSVYLEKCYYWFDIEAKFLVEWPNRVEDQRNK